MARRRRRSGAALLAAAVVALLAYVAWTYAMREWRHMRFRSALESTDVAERAPAREPLPTPPAVGSAVRDGLAVPPPEAVRPAESLSRDDRQELEKILERANPGRAVEKKKK